ncbi:MAG: hypothetical protein IJO77_07085 [Oscillospiraceae bacterium]|nr:hypothetical protein [Oscillospiraceae bacterium]
MSRRDRNTQQPTIGGSSLIVTFAVLCLTVFALLGLSTVRADQRLADVSANAAADYYDAELQAETILSELRSGNIPDGVSKNGDVYSYMCPVSDTLSLQVEVRIENSQWEILCWRTVTTLEWTESDSLNVWNGK